MQKEEVEAIAESTLERHLGDVNTLGNIREVLRQSNVRVLREGQPTETAQTANLVQSLFISHGNLARALADAVTAMQHLQNRIEDLEKAIPAMQEAVINLQIRVRELEPKG